MKAIKLTAMLTLGFVLVACGTYVPLYSVRTPPIDTSNVERMAIRPFEDRTGRGSSIAASLTDNSRQQITNTGKFTMVSPTDPNAEGIFTGVITVFDTKDDSYPRTRTRSDGTQYQVTVYRREVNFRFTLSVINARTDMPFGEVNKGGSDISTSEENPSGLRSAHDMAMGIANREMRNLERNILPYQVESGRHKLVKESSKDKMVKERMKQAENFVKSKDYARALALYEEIARDHNSYAAKMNADYVRASVSSAAAASDELDKLFAERGGPIDKAVEGAVAALAAALPAGENITIMKSQSAQLGMLDRIADRLTDAVIQSGHLTLIDRSNQALIAAEQDFQMSGNVSDESAISIGRQLGIRYIVLCWISGEMSERKFYIRALDIETSAIAVQSSFDI